MIDFTSGIAGPYCTKLLADAGAEVIKVESDAGDPLRRWTAGDMELPPGEDGALFRFLNASKQSLVGTPESPRVGELVDSSDLVVDDFRPTQVDVLESLISGSCVRLSITPFGRGGPWSLPRSRNAQVVAVGFIFQGVWGTFYVLVCTSMIFTFGVLLLALAKM